MPRVVARTVDRRRAEKRRAWEAEVNGPRPVEHEATLKLHGERLTYRVVELTEHEPFRYEVRGYTDAELKALSA